MLEIILCSNVVAWLPSLKHFDSDYIMHGYLVKVVNTSTVTEYSDSLTYVVFVKLRRG